MASYFFDSLCDATRLKTEILASSIVAELLSINTLENPDKTEVIFSKEIKTSDLLYLKSLINQHSKIIKDNIIVEVSSSQPFGSKVLPNGSKLFRRVRGVSGTVQNQPDNIDFLIPFSKCKITGLQIINGKLGDKATFQVLDTPQGTISGTPYAVLNTFGQDVYIVPDLASYPSKYDADLIGGMTLRLVYDAVDGELLPRPIYVNLDLHEVIDP